MGRAKRPGLPDTRKLLPGQWTEGDGYWTGGGWIYPKIHPQPGEEVAEKWLNSLTGIDGVSINIGWRALDTWKGRGTVITITDILTGLDSGPLGWVVPNCVQIDVWAEDWDLAKEVAQIIWDAAGKAEDIMPQRQPQIIQPDEPPRLSLDLTFGNLSAGHPS